MKGPFTMFLCALCRYEDCEKSGFQDGGHSSAVHGGDACRSAIKLTNKISSKCCCHFSESTVSVSDGYLMRLQCQTLALLKALVKPLISFYLMDVKKCCFTLICSTNAFESQLVHIFPPREKHLLCDCLLVF